MSRTASRTTSRTASRTTSRITSIPASPSSTGSGPDVRGLRVAALVTDNFEQVELTGPRAAMEQAGAQVSLVSSHPGEIQGMQHDRRADRFPVDLLLEQARPEDFDAVLLPGGVMNSDQIRMLPAARHFVQAMQLAGKPIFVICHGAWLLVSAGLARGRTLTSWPSLQDDIRNAGGTWVDDEVVVDGQMVSSRKPDDLPAFNAKLLQVLAQSRQASATLQSDG